MRIILSLGGGALRDRGKQDTLSNRLMHLTDFASAVAPLRLAGHELVITHPTGPQAGQRAMQAAATPDHPYPFEGADTGEDSMVGRLLERALERALPGGTAVASLLTQVRVDRRDPAFRLPDAPVGPVYSESEARTLAAERGWRVARQGDGWRRVVACPHPLEILEAGVIDLLVRRDVVVVCAGAGGIPVVECAEGDMFGVDGAVDADATSAMLACQLHADRLVLLTDIEAVMTGPRGSLSDPLRMATPAMLDALRMPRATMGRKVAAASDFVRTTGAIALIGRVEDLAAMMKGDAGTRIGIQRS